MDGRAKEEDCSLRDGGIMGIYKQVTSIEFLGVYNLGFSLCFLVGPHYHWGRDLVDTKN